MFNSFECLAPSVFLFHELRSLARMRTIISVFIFHFCSVRVCLFVLNNVFTIKDTKLLTGRGLRDATDVVHPYKKQQVKPWRPMLYWTGVEEYVYPLNVNLCCFELFTSGSMTARNILPWLWLIFENNFVLLGQVLVGVHSWNRSWRIWKKEYSLQFTKVKIHTCILWLTTELYHYVKYEVKTMFLSVSELLNRKDWRWSSA